MRQCEYLLKAASARRVHATKAERKGLSFLAAVLRKRALELEKLAKLAKVGCVEEK